MICCEGQMAQERVYSETPITRQEWYPKWRQQPEHWKVEGRQCRTGATNETTSTSLSELGTTIARALRLIGSTSSELSVKTDTQRETAYLSWVLMGKKTKKGCGQRFRLPFQVATGRLLSFDTAGESSCVKSFVDRVCKDSGKEGMFALTLNAFPPLREPFALLPAARPRAWLPQPHLNTSPQCGWCQRVWTKESEKLIACPYRISLSVSKMHELVAFC